MKLLLVVDGIPVVKKRCRLNEFGGKVGTQWWKSNKLSMDDNLPHELIQTQSEDPDCCTHTI